MGVAYAGRQDTIMITTNALQRTFHIRCGGSTGTAFTIDVDRKQYLVTAAHMLSNFVNDVIEIYHEDKWKTITCKLVGKGQYDPRTNNGEPDVAVLAPALQLSPTFPLPPTTSNLVLGQAIYFLGFPYGRAQHVQKELNRDFPLPLVKGGLLSAISTKDSGILLLDGHNNPGFSGGPVIFIPNGRQPSRSEQFSVCGVISGYPTYREEVFDGAGNAMGFIRNNPGMIVAYDIKFATGFIASNPIGFELSGL